MNLVVIVHVNARVHSLTILHIRLVFWYLYTHKNIHFMKNPMIYSTHVLCILKITQGGLVVWEKGSQLASQKRLTL